MEYLKLGPLAADCVKVQIFDILSWVQVVFESTFDFQMCTCPSQSTENAVVVQYDLNRVPVDWSKLEAVLYKLFVLSCPTKVKLDFTVHRFEVHLK